jgi:phospholipid/cholesterol/gamma-HCH transport system substrate-binding protein
MHRNIVETVIGAVVLAVALLFLGFAYSSANFGGNSSGYLLEARFQRADGIVVGGDVRVSGVKVGQVESIALDTRTYEAKLMLRIDPAFVFPDDTVAIISSDGLLGGKTVSLSPGGSPDLLADSDVIQYTQSTPSLEQLLGQVIFSLKGAGSSDGASAAAPTGGAPPVAAPVAP